MPRVWSDVLTADVREVTLLSLLDLPAAFDCVDHAILLQRLEAAFGIIGTVLDWIRSYLTDRTQQVAYCRQLSGATYAVRCAARVSAWPIALRAVHCRALQYRRVPWSAATSVRRRLPSLHQYIRRRRPAHTGQVQCVPRGCAPLPPIDTI